MLNDKSMATENCSLSIFDDTSSFKAIDHYAKDGGEKLFTEMPRVRVTNL